MQAGSGAKPPVGIAFDCDLGTDIDGVLALALLYGLDTKNEARVISVSVSKANLKSAALADALVRFYVTASLGQFAGFARTLPVGYAEDGKLPEDSAIFRSVLERRSPEGKPLYPNSVHNLNDTAECGALIRNALTAQHDGNAIVLLAGPATNLAKVLSVGGAKEVIAAKVRMLVIAKPESGSKTDLAAARKVFSEWPSPVVICGEEIGAALPYPGESIEEDYSWAAAHPVTDAYRSFKATPYDAPATAMAAALYAARPEQGYFRLSEPGTVSIADNGRLDFATAAAGKHRRLLLDPPRKEAILKAYRELASAKPVLRRPRFLPPVEPEKPKPSAAKPPSP